VDAARLTDLEAALTARIREAGRALAAASAPARPGEPCRWCDVRQFCEAFWANLPAGAADIDFRVAGEPTETGFHAIGVSGDEVAVVFTSDVGKSQGPFHAGERLRVLNPVTKGKVVELRAWTECFHLQG
jgi:hypothetical protein